MASSSTNVKPPSPFEGTGVIAWNAHIESMVPWMQTQSVAYLMTDPRPYPDEPVRPVAPHPMPEPTPVPENETAPQRKERTSTDEHNLKMWQGALQNFGLQREEYKLNLSSYQKFCSDSEKGLALMKTCFEDTVLSRVCICKTSGSCN